MTYLEKLKDPRWQKRRLEIFNRDEFRCINCGDDEKTLNVDHKIYRKGFDPWEYPDEDLQTLCEDCHKKISAARKRIIERIGDMGTVELKHLERVLQEVSIFDDEVLIVHGLDIIRMDASRFLHRMQWLEPNCHVGRGATQKSLPEVTAPEKPDYD